MVSYKVTVENLDKGTGNYFTSDDIGEALTQAAEGSGLTARAVLYLFVTAMLEEGMVDNAIEITPLEEFLKSSPPAVCRKRINEYLASHYGSTEVN